MTEREILTRQLHKIHGTKTQNQLMDKLYDKSLCSNNCVTFSDVATFDLLCAYNSGLREVAE